MKRAFRLEVLAAVLVLLLGLALRLHDLSAFLVHDEMRWACRSVGFRTALAEHDWGETYRVGHPGVVTMWLGTLTIPRGADAGEACEAFDDYRHFATDDLPATTKDALAQVGGMVFQGRFGVAVFTWLCVIVIYLLIRFLWDPTVAILSLILIALDPFQLALSRFLHTDAVLTGLMTLSVLGLLASMRRGTSHRAGMALVLTSGVAGGLAAVQKSPAAFLALFAGLVLTVDLIRRGASRETLSRLIQALALWGTSAAVVYTAAWPTMWSDPVGTIGKVLHTATRYAAEGHTPGNYFLGQPVHDPGWLFYPVAAIFRLSPLALFGLAFSLVLIGKKGIRKDGTFHVLTLLVYSGLFAAFMSLGDKMFDRYLLPVFPTLGIAAAAGLQWTGNRLLRWITKRSESLPRPASAAYPAVLVLVLLVVQMAILLPHRPYYLTYYNPLVGGPKAAREALLMGWGEGYDQAAAYLNERDNAEQLHVTTPTTAAFAPLFRGETWPMDRYFAWQSDYVVFYVSEMQRRQQENLVEEYLLDPSEEPEHVVSLQGVDYAWIYGNDDHEEAMDYVDQHSQADHGECLLVNGKSLFAEHYVGDLPVYTFSPEYDPQGRSYTYPDRANMTRFLDELSTSCSRVWHPHYPGAEGSRYADLLHARATLLDEAVFPSIKVTQHRLLKSEMPAQPVDLRFGGLRLREFGVTDPPPAWGRDGGLVLGWEAVVPLDEDYTVYLHLYDAHDHRIALGDSLIVDRTLEPTSQWETGITKRALYHLPIPPATPPGDYRLELGVYQVDTGERLPLLGPDAGDGQTAAQFRVMVGVPDQVPDVADLNIPYAVELELTPNLALVGYGLQPGDTQNPRAMLAGKSLGVRLFWHARGSMKENYRLQLALDGRGVVTYGQRMFDLTSTDYPTSRWRPDELLGEWYYLPTQQESPTGEAMLMLDVVDEEGRSQMDEPVPLSTLWVQSTLPSFDRPPDMDQRDGTTFGDHITLLGHDLTSAATPGETAAVTLYWKAEQQIGTDYKVFVHLYDGQGGILAQRDRRPGLGARATTTWQQGEIVADRYYVEMPSDAPAGTYEVGVGLYDPRSGDRLRAFGPDGDRLAQDRVILGRLEIAP